LKDIWKEEYSESFTGLKDIWQKLWRKHIQWMRRKCSFSQVHQIVIGQSFEHSWVDRS
jgi:hypothetical protein